MIYKFFILSHDIKLSYISNDITKRPLGFLRFTTKYFFKEVWNHKFNIDIFYIFIGQNLPPKYYDVAVNFSERCS